MNRLNEKTRVNKKKLTVNTYMPSLPSEVKELILRSKLLAKKNKKSDEEIVINYVNFRLGMNEQYGIIYQSVKEVIPCKKLITIPHLSEEIAGVFNWRSNLITVIDLKKYFHFSLDTNTKNGNAYIIVIESHGLTIGMLVDNIQGSGSYLPSALQQPFPQGVGINPIYLQGLDRSKISIINIDYIATELKKKFLKEEK